MITVAFTKYSFSNSGLISYASCLHVLSTAFTRPMSGTSISPESVTTKLIGSCRSSMTRKLTRSPGPSFVVSFRTSIEVVKATVLVPVVCGAAGRLSIPAEESERGAPGGTATAGKESMRKAAQQVRAKRSGAGEEGGREFMAMSIACLKLISK